MMMYLEESTRKQAVLCTDFHGQSRGIGIPFRLVRNFHLLIESLVVGGEEGVDAIDGLQGDLFTRAIQGHTHSVGLELSGGGGEGKVTT